jgi:hypothetical protein
VELLEIILTLVDLLVSAADLAAWFKSRSNRMQRKAARQMGVPPPARNGWTWAFVLLIPVVVFITSWIFIRRV